jgi:hypothetical protein
MLLQRELKNAGIKLFQWTGRYADWEPEERNTRQAEPVSFRGEIPPMAGTEMNQYRVVYSRPRALITHAQQVIYTERGMAWVGGRLERRFSFQEVGLRQIWERPGGPTARYTQASVLQAQTPCTYGDWVSEHVSALARGLSLGMLVEPLLLPEWWIKKPYVKRDLQLLGVRAEAVGAPVLIEEATVLNKTRSGHYWTRGEAQAVLAAMKIQPQPCAPGSALYLSRKGLKGEGPQRQINNEVTEAAMEAAGVKVVRSAGLTREQFIDLAHSAETVFSDHGSAAFNIMHWQTRRFVELFTPDYWDSCFLFLTDSLGISDYHLWQVDTSTTVDGFTNRIRNLMSEPVAWSESVIPPERISE